MKRRTLIAALVSGTAGIAGCQSLDTGDGEGAPGEHRTTFGVPPAEPTTTEWDDPSTGTTEKETPVARPPPAVQHGYDLTPPGALSRTIETQVGPRRRIVLGDRPLGGLPPGLRMVVGFLDTPTRQSPARLWIGVQNASEENRVVEFGPTPPFSGYRDRRGDVGPSTEPPPPLFLVPATEAIFAVSEVVPDAPTDGCWRATGNPRDHVTLPDPGGILLEPEEAIVGEYYLLTGSSRECFPPREVYRFGGRSGVGLLVSVWTPQAATPGNSGFDRSVPPLPVDDSTHWYHEATSRTGVYLEPAAERVELPDASVEVRLENFSTTTLTINPDHWVLYKLHGGEWKRVAPWRFNMPLSFVPPGGHHAIAFRIDDRADDRSAASSGTRLTGIGPGLYALQHGRSGPNPGEEGPLTVGAPETERPVGDRPRAVYAALLRVVGDALVLTPTSDVQDTVREGDRLTVRVGIDPDRPPEKLVVRRAGRGADPAVELIPEQVFQTPALRNALAYLVDEPDVSTVRVRTNEYAVAAPIRRFGQNGAGNRLRFAYGHGTFVAEAHEEG